MHWIGGALHGDLGLSYAYGSPIAPLIASSLAVSAPLALMAMALAAIVGLAAGVYAADRRGRAGDAIVMGFSQVGIAVPNFWLAILLVLVFAVTLRLVPAGGFPGWHDPSASDCRADPAGDRAWRRAGGDRHARLRDRR